MISEVIAAVKDVVAGLGVLKYSHYRLSGGTSISFYVKDTSFAKVGDNLTWNGQILLITAIVCGTSITASLTLDTMLGDQQGVILLPAIHFKYGTVRRVNNEITNEQFASTFTPFVYFVEVASSTQDISGTSLFSSNGEQRIFVLDQCNYSDWQTSEEYYTNALIRCEKITEALIEGFHKSPRIGKLTSSRTWNHINAGVYSDKGGERNMFNMLFTGVELRINLPIKKNCNC